jgi:hypothetical protein
MNNITRRAVIQTNGRYYRAAWAIIDFRTGSYIKNIPHGVQNTVFIDRYFVSFRPSGTDEEIINLEPKTADVRELKSGRVLIKLD